MMKRTVLLLLAVICGIWAAAGQDLIVKRDASRIEAHVTEISPQQVRYKRFSNPDGPTYVLPVAQIDHILFANGEKEVFAPQAPAAAAASETAASDPVAVPAVQPAPAQEAKRYEIGDYYEENGLRGVVCQLSDDGRHGLVLSLEEASLPWSVFRKEDYRVVGSSDRRDGSANMAAVAKHIAENGLSWSDFPAFDWCRNQGEGWYLPAIDEILVIGHLYNGGTRIASSRQARNRFNEALKHHGGERMDRMVFYFSSTEADEKSAFTSHMSTEPPYVTEIPKHNKFLVRAVHKF